MLNYRMTCLLGLLSLVVACATQQHSKITSKSIDKPAKEVASFVEAQAMKCWQEEPTFFTNGIMVKSRQSIQGSAVITASNWPSGSGPQPPFLIIEITENGPGSSEVSISGIKSATSQTFIEDVSRWVDGHIECSS